MLFSDTVKQRGLGVQAGWEGPNQRYRADATRLQQMLSNIVGNAVKFTTNGCVEIRGIEVSRQGNVAVLEFSVADTGIGISQEKLDQLFKPFSQLDDTDSRKHGGTGLGLSIVRSLAVQMGGDVGVSSEFGKGSRFWFRINAEVLLDGEDCRHIRREGASVPLTDDNQIFSAVVLVVEDNKVNQMVIKAALKYRGVGYESVANGREAVDAITGGGVFGLVLMDVQMPEMDGLEATRLIREWEKVSDRPRLPIIALTAGAFDEERERCITAGMDDFLVKPLDVDHLADILRKWQTHHN